MRVAVLLFWPNETGQCILLWKALWKMIKSVSGCRVYIQKSNTRAFFFTFCNDLLRGDFAAGIWSLFEVSQGKEAPDGAGRALGSSADSLLSKETDITDATKLFCWVAKYRYSFIMQIHQTVTLVQGQLTYCIRHQLLVHSWKKSRLRAHQRKAFNQQQMTPTATSSVAKFWSCWYMVEVQGRPLSQRCHKHNWNTCCGQLHAQNWGQQGLHAKTARCFGSSLKMFCGSSRLWGQSQVTLWKLKNRFGSNSRESAS